MQQSIVRRRCSRTSQWTLFHHLHHTTLRSTPTRSELALSGTMHVHDSVWQTLPLVLPITNPNITLDHLPYESEFT